MNVHRETRTVATYMEALDTALGEVIRKLLVNWKLCCPGVHSIKSR